MTFNETIKMALTAVSANKFRTFLTLLGIIIGVAAVITMVSLGSGTQIVVSGQFQSMNIRQVVITSNYTLNYQQQAELEYADRTYLKESTIGVEEIVPFKYYYQGVTLGDKQITRNICATIAESAGPVSATIKYGRYLQESDIANYEKVVVIGEDVLAELVPDVNDESVLGRTVIIDGQKFTLVGVLAKTTTAIMISSYSVVVPFSTAQNLWRNWGAEVDNFLLSYDTKTTEQDIISQLDYLMSAKYGKTSNGKERYMLEGLQKQVDLMTTIVRVFTYLLGGIATISLFVGGIGVMNIMLVTVKERTEEIGLRLAIGATRQNVQSQFLTESVILSVGGGVIGIIIGCLFSSVINLILKQNFNWWEGQIPMWVILTAFSFTVGIGVIFGFYPAFRASRLDPIEALRNE